MSSANLSGEYNNQIEITNPDSKDNIWEDEDQEKWEDFNTDGFDIPKIDISYRDKAKSRTQFIKLITEERKKNNKLRINNQTSSIFIENNRTVYIDRGGNYRFPVNS